MLRPSKRRGRLDERLCSAKRFVRDQTGGSESISHSETAAGRATLLTHDEVADGVFTNSVTRSTNVFEREISALQRHERAARLRRVSVAGKRVWATWPEVLKNFAKHYKTGEPMPQALLDKVEAAEKFNQGYKTPNTCRLAARSSVASTHPSQIPTDAIVFEKEALQQSGRGFSTGSAALSQFLFFATPSR